MHTLVLQSCRADERSGWLAQCLDSVRAWAESQRFDYRFLDDGLFEMLPDDLRPGGRITPVIASDLARLLWLQAGLRQGHARVLWLDADVLVFRPEELELPADDHAVGRELWVQPAEDCGRLKIWKKVHNAALLAVDQGAGRNSFLDFYADTAQRLLRANRVAMPAQFIGPKLLSALHNVVQFPVMEQIGMLSPVVVENLLGADNGACEALQARASGGMAAANLCRSSVRDGQLSGQQMQQLIERLRTDPQRLDPT